MREVRLDEIAEVLGEGRVILCSCRLVERKLGVKEIFTAQTKVIKVHQSDCCERSLTLVLSLIAFSLEFQSLCVSSAFTVAIFWKSAGYVSFLIALEFFC